MVYRFILISDEVEDFMREIKIDSDATFLDFHKAILKSCGYNDDQITSFTICENGWEKCQVLWKRKSSICYIHSTRWETVFSSSNSLKSSWVRV